MVFILNVLRTKMKFHLTSRYNFLFLRNENHSKWQNFILWSNHENYYLFNLKRHVELVSTSHILNAILKNEFIKAIETCHSELVEESILICIYFLFVSLSVLKWMVFILNVLRTKTKFHLTSRYNFLFLRNENHSKWQNFIVWSNHENYYLFNLKRHVELVSTSHVEHHICDPETSPGWRYNFVTQSLSRNQIKIHKKTSLNERGFIFRI